jgi:hypothetical protein
VLRLLATLGLAAFAGASQLAAQDVLAVGSATALAGETVLVPVAIRDLAGTPLDEGDGADAEIQGFAFRLDFAPAAAVASVTFQQAGATAGLDPVFPVIQPAADHIVVLLSFDEGTAPLAFTLGAAPPGDLVGNLVFTLAAEAIASSLTLTLDPATATLVNDSATLSETVAGGSLAVVDGVLALWTPLFADGFETADFSAWSAIVP